MPHQRCLGEFGLHSVCVLETAWHGMMRCVMMQCDVTRCHVTSRDGNVKMACDSGCHW